MLNEIQRVVHRIFIKIKISQPAKQIVNISHIFIVVIWWVSDMELSTYHLKNHLQDTPLHDWILLHGKKWLHEHSDVFQEIYGTPEEAEAFHLQTELQTLQRKLQYDCDDGAHIPIHTFNTFYEHVLNSCYAKNIPPPQRINHNVFSSSVASIDQQHDTYVIVQSVSLKAPFSIDKQNVRLKVQPDILLSRPLATLLFQHQLPPAKSREIAGKLMMAEVIPLASPLGFKSPFKLIARCKRDNHRITKWDGLRYSPRFSF